MSWPGITDFSEAVQNPGICFAGTELEGGTVAVNQRGMPLVYSGSFASVYSVSVNGGAYAVRCFTREVKDQQTRYNQLSDYLINVLPPSFVHFEFVEEGINLKGDWYPIVKMEWVEGAVLSAFVDAKLDEPDALRRVAAQWRGGTTASLRGLRIAHNDLQHGNVMVQANGNIRLVDYDGMFLPQFRGERSPELGHKNYQHPQRSAADYDDYVDNFPTLVVYLSLLAVAAEPDLWSFYNDDNLIFTAKDYADPGKSEVFKRLKQSGDPAVVELTKRLAEYCGLADVAKVPDLETILQGTPPSAAPAAKPRSPAPRRTKRRVSAPPAAKPHSAAPRQAGGRASAPPRPGAQPAGPKPAAAGTGRRQPRQVRLPAPKKPPTPSRPRRAARQAFRPAPAARSAAAASTARAAQAVAAGSASAARAGAADPAAAAKGFLKVALGVAATVLIIVAIIVALSVWAIVQRGW